MERSVGNSVLHRILSFVTWLAEFGRSADRAKQIGRAVRFDLSVPWSIA